MGISKRIGIISVLSVCLSVCLSLSLSVSLSGTVSKATIWKPLRCRVVHWYGHLRGQMYHLSSSVCLHLSPSQPRFSSPPKSQHFTAMADKTDVEVGVHWGIPRGLGGKFCKMKDGNICQTNVCGMLGVVPTKELNGFCRVQTRP